MVDIYDVESEVYDLENKMEELRKRVDVSYWKDMLREVVYSKKAIGTASPGNKRKAQTVFDNLIDKAESALGGE